MYMSLLTLAVYPYLLYLNLVILVIITKTYSLLLTLTISLDLIHSMMFLTINGFFLTNGFFQHLVVQVL